MVALNSKPLNFKIKSPTIHWLTNSIHLFAVPIIFFASLCATVTLPYACPSTSGNLTTHWNGAGQAFVEIFGTNYSEGVSDSN